MDYWDGEDGSGFVAHEDTIQGRQAGKSDPGPEFDRARFIASLNPEEEEDMKLKFIQAPEGPEWATNGTIKMGVTSPQIKTDLVNLGLAEGAGLAHDPFPVAQEFADWLIDIAAASGGGTSTGFPDFEIIGTAKAK